MGLEIDRTDFDEADHLAYGERLEAGLEALGQLLERPGFGEGPPSLGVELELYLVDRDGHAAPLNTELAEAADDPALSLELNRFNVEFDFDPVPAAGAPFSHYARLMDEKVRGLDRVAEGLDAGVVAVGILPTLRDRDFGPGVISPLRRYKALTEGLQRLSGGQFRLHIDGPEPLRIETDGIFLEGATTSFQVHLRVEPRDFAATYNALQLATPVALALSANAPVLLGHRLWHETRIALFKQSIDVRRPEREYWRPPARVSFGSGWVRHGARELFTEGVRLHPALLPVVSDEDPVGVVRAGGVPRLAELRLHNGTIWAWNRPVYDSADGGHLRIELRALPAGPTADDMVAGAALLLGLAVSLRDGLDALLPALPFRLAEYNFYRAAQFGMDAPILWPERRQQGLRERSVVDVAGMLLGRARDGLGKLGVADDEIERLLGLIADRLRARQNGATWQLDRLRQLDRTLPRDEALRELLVEYRLAQASGRPVHDWSLAP
jgi:gamma-glutamyl:cysteine ligase YbdK (ATP-grasp superfamily)